MTREAVPGPGAGASILWRRLDRPGHEAARLEAAETGYRLAGTAAFLHEGRPAKLDYDVSVDRYWRTVSARVSGWIGDRAVDVDIAVEHGGRWRMNGADVPGVGGAIDLDLNFSPSTNLLPIRRLALEVGAEASVRSAWLRFPGFELEPLDQVYRRVSESAYRYESAGGRFVAELAVDAFGFVTRYPGFCDIEGGALA